MIGVPNYSGINHWFLRRLAPQMLSTHNIEAMDYKKWKSFEEKFKLQIIFKNYIGGFEPQNFNRWERKNLITFILKTTAKIISLLLHSNYKFLRKYNSKIFSAYLIGIYKKPE